MPLCGIEHSLQAMSDRQRHLKIEQIFDQVVGCPTLQRKELLSQFCNDDTALRQEVESLITASGKAQGFLSIAPAGVEHVFADKLRPHSLLDGRFGPYRLLQVLERGGMGVVFLAERADGHYDEKVAIKFANYKVEVANLMERFSRERQILAKLRHPNVARLLDAGTSTDGYPYLVMEYISGLSIDKYCQFKSLKPKDTLRLMQSVCDTVQHAHQNLIVHCDLKPENILVTKSGRPILLDFGIAQLLDPIKRQAQEPAEESLASAMTPAFAAPEQISGGEITTATDVHALGNILYRLLTGVEPQYISSTKKWLSQVEYGGKPRLSPPANVAPQHVRRELCGDISNIVLRALGHNPATRYRSAQALAEDIERYLSGNTVVATRDSFLYRSRKFISRHRPGVILSCIVLVSVIAGVTSTINQWQKAKDARISAETRLNEIRTLADTIVFELPQTISALPGSTELRERLLNSGVAYLDRLSAEQQDAKLLTQLASAYHELATIQGNPMYSNLGDPESALGNYKHSISIREAQLEENPDSYQTRLQLATSYLMMSGIYGALLNDAVEARLLNDKCLELIKPVPASDWPAVVPRRLSCLTLAAHWSNVDSKFDVAALYLEKTRRELSALPVDGSSLPLNEKYRFYGRMHEEWAEIFAASGNSAMAVQHEQQRMSWWLRLTQEQTNRSRLLGAAYQGLAARLAMAGEHTSALDAYEESLLHWHKWQDLYPADTGASNAVAIVHAELADLIWRTRPETTHRQLACQHYASSVAALDKFSSDKWPLPRRYSWSPSAQVIKQQRLDRCDLNESDPDVGVD